MPEKARLQTELDDLLAYFEKATLSHGSDEERFEGERGQYRSSDRQRLGSWNWDRMCVCE